MTSFLSTLSNKRLSSLLMKEIKLEQLKIKEKIFKNPGDKTTQFQED